MHKILAARHKHKLELANETDPIRKAVLDKIDDLLLSLKISTNSVYGFTAALIGQLTYLEILLSVTGF